eukprot:1844297-Rhodomonas_salina.1
MTGTDVADGSTSAPSRSTSGSITAGALCYLRARARPALTCAVLLLLAQSVRQSVLRRVLPQAPRCCAFLRLPASLQ